MLSNTVLYIILYVEGFALHNFRLCVKIAMCLCEHQQKIRVIKFLQMRADGEIGEIFLLAIFLPLQPCKV